MKTDSRMFAVHCVEHFVEVWTTKVRGRLQAGEYAATWHSLEMLLADVLQTRWIISVYYRET